MSEPQPTEEDGELILPPADDGYEFVPETEVSGGWAGEDDEPEAMTGSAVPDPVAEILEGPDDSEVEPARAGYPITIALDAEGNGSAHVGIFASSIDSVEIDDVDPECIFAGEAAVGVAIIEVRGASTRSKPVSGIVIIK